MISVPLRTKRYQKAQLAQKIQHAVPSIVLLGDGLTRLGDGAHGQSLWLGVAEVIAAGLVIVTVVRGIIRFRKGTLSIGPDTHDGLDWIDICIAAMLVVEGFMHRHETGRFPRPTILLAAVLFALGLFHGRVAAFAHQRRSMHVSAEGISIPGRLPFMRLTLPWDKVASVDFADGIAHIVAADGRQRRVDLSDSLDPDSVTDALQAAKAHHDAFKASETLVKKRLQN